MAFFMQSFRLDDLRVILGGLLVGWLYTLLLPLTGLRFPHFLPRFLLSVGFLQAMSVALLVWFSWRVLPRRWPLWALPLVLLALHFSGWIWWYSRWAADGQVVKMLLVIGTTMTALAAAALLEWSRRFVDGPGIALSLVLLFFLVLGVYGTIRYPSTDQIRSLIPENIRARSMAQEPSTLALLYPFSVSVTDGVQRTPALFPDVPRGRKIIYVVLDAFREDFLGKTMSGIDVTPYLEKLAAKNVYFPNYRVQSTWTKPSTASLFTGRYVRDHATFLGGKNKEHLREIAREYQERTQSNPDQFFTHVLPEDFRTLAERLRNRGFVSAGFTTMAPITKSFQFDQGFDYYGDSFGEGLSGDRQAFESMLFWLLRRQPEKSFLYLHLSGPHYPYDAADRNETFWRQTRYMKNGSLDLKHWRLPPINELLKGMARVDTSRDLRYEKRFVRHLYAADLNYYDQHLVPRMVRTLRQLELWEDPFVSLTSDHGEGLFDHENFFGHVDNLYEETINVPLLVSPPRRGPALNLPSDRGTWNLETIDLTATLLEYGGASPEDLPGNSLYGVSGNTAESHHYKTAFAEKGFVDRIDEAAVIRGTDKLIHDYQRSKGRLFNLDNDSDLDEEREGSPELEASLFEAIRKTLGSTDQLNRKPAPPQKIPESEKQQLKGLGYLE